MDTCMVKSSLIALTIPYMEVPVNILHGYLVVVVLIGERFTHYYTFITLGEFILYRSAMTGNTCN